MWFGYQLFGLGQITKSVKKKKEKKYNAFRDVLDVNINEKLTNDIYSLLDDLQIKPTITVSLSNYL